MDIGDFHREVLVGVVSAGVTAPLAWMAGVAREKARARRPLKVHVEQDTAIIFGTTFDWESFPYYFDCDPDQLPLNPPDLGVEWWSWATANHGLPALFAEISITLIPQVASTIAVDGLRVKLVSAEPAPQGCVVVHPVGGASIVHRQASIELLGTRPPKVEFLEEGSADHRTAFTFALAPGEVARLSITSRAIDYTYLYKWTALLDVLVNGNRRTIEVSNGGKPFVLHGGANCREFEWVGEKWIESNYFGNATSSVS